MRAQLLVLPAVLLNLAAAGLIRHNRSPVRPGLYARFPNASSIAEATLKSTTLSQTLIPTTLPLKAAQSPSADDQIESTKPASGQVGSVPAFGSGPGAATTEEAESLTTTSKPQIPTSSHRSVEHEYSAVPVSSSNGGPSAQQTVKQSSQSSASAVTQTSVAAASQSLSAVSVSNTTAVGGTVSSKSSIATTPVATQQPAQSASAEGSATAAASQQPAAAPTVAPDQGNGNTAMALGFNSVFASMSEGSPCDANNKNEAVACVNGKYAQCSNGKYALTACPQGQQCFALPLSTEFHGITVQCASLQDANQRLGQNSTTPAAVPPSQSTSSTSQQPTAENTTVTSSTSTAVPAPALGSAQPSAAQPSEPTTSKPVQISTSKTTFVGQQPTTTPEQSTTTVTKPSATTTTTEASESPVTTPTTTSSQPSSQTASPTSAKESDTPSNTPTPTPVDPTPAVSTSSEDFIIVTPIPDKRIQGTEAAAKVAVVSSSEITAAPVVPLTVTETVIVTSTTTVHDRS